nr:hypothetical protein [Tanacetum cinerariifolium]
MLVAMPFHNLEIRDGNDPPLGVYIDSRFPVNSEPVELLTFPPPVRDSLKGVLVIVYRLLCSIFLTRGTSPKILEVYVDEVWRWNDTTTSVIRLLLNDTQALSGLYTTPSSIHRQLARSCSNHDPELEVSSVEKTIQNAERIELWVDHLHLFQTPDMKVRPSER